MNSMKFFSRFRWWHEAAIAMMLIVLVTVAGVLMPTFLKIESQLTLSRQLWELAILTLGMTLIVITGGIDLSVGSTMGLCAVMFGISYATTQSIAVASIASLMTGAACGAMNGALISTCNALFSSIYIFAGKSGIHCTIISHPDPSKYTSLCQRGTR